MKRLCVAILLASVAGSASAFIPPTYRIAVVAQERDDRALGHALVEYMAAEQAFFRRRDDAFNRASQACLESENAAECIRGVVAGLELEPGTRSLTIVAAPAGDGRQRWQCIGSGQRPAPAEAVDMVFDVQAALFGPAEERNLNLRAAVRCIQEAANESSPQ